MIQINSLSVISPNFYPLYNNCQPFVAESYCFPSVFLLFLCRVCRGSDKPHQTSLSAGPERKAAIGTYGGSFRGQSRLLYNGEFEFEFLQPTNPLSDLSSELATHPKIKKSSFARFSVVPNLRFCVRN